MANGQTWKLVDTVAARAGLAALTSLAQLAEAKLKSKFSNHPRHALIVPVRGRWEAPSLGS